MISIDELEGRINDRFEVELKYFEIKGSVLFRPRTYILIHSMVSPALSLCTNVWENSRDTYIGIQISCRKYVKANIECMFHTRFRYRHRT